MEPDIRQRNLTKKLEAGATSKIDLTPRTAQNNLGERKVNGISCLGLFLMFLFTLVVFVIANKAHGQLPDVTNIDNDNEFDTDKAKYYLDGITKIGYRSVGSYENDVLTVDYIIKEVEKIISQASTDYQISYELQHVSGGLALSFLAANFANVYQNVSNIIVHLKVKGEQENETGNVLLNAHFDTEMKTTGASDDAVSCAIMLETMRALSKSPNGTIKHGVIFLFNGAEEGILQGSHGFITQHPLANKINTFINLEAAGAGGREVLFQTGPGHPWLIHAYASAAKYPFAFTLAQEVFQSGIIPSDTDFRIFRDYGKLAGIDLAYASNGYVYHTRYDNTEAIPDGSIKRAGENILELTKALCKSPYLLHPENFEHAELVFFDFLGYFMVLYPKTIGKAIEISFSLAAVVFVIYKMLQPKQSATIEANFKSVATALVISLVAIITAFSAVISEAAFVTMLGKSLTWYGHPWFALCLYGSTAMSIVYSVHHICRKFIAKNNQPLHHYERSIIYSNILAVALTITILTLKGFVSTYVIALWLIFPFTFLCLIQDGLKNSRGAMNLNQCVFQHIAATSIPALITAYYVCIVYDIFIPLMGRIGSEIPPEFVTASLALVVVVLFCSYSTSLIYITRDSMMFIRTFALLSVAFFLIAISGIIPPYSRENPVSPKRINLQHISRKFYDQNNKVTKQDSGIWIQPQDFTGISSLSGNKYVSQATKVICDGVYCGYPHYLPARSLLRHSWYLKAPSPDHRNQHSFKVTKREMIQEKFERVHIEITGPDHMTMYITTRNDHRLVKWSLNDEIPVSKPSHDGQSKDNCYFVYYAHGYFSEETWKFFLDFHVSKENRDQPLAELALALHYVHGNSSNTALLRTVANSLPSWAVDTSWVSNYESFIL